MIAMYGKRIAVWGNSSSGKTTLAAALAERCGIPHIEMDAIFWRPDWVESPIEEFRVNINSAIEAHPDGWVMDGNYSRVQDLVLPHVDTVVWIRLPLWLVLWRCTVRCIGRIISKDPLWGINRETWSKSFFSRESLLWYILKTWRGHVKRRRLMLATIPNRGRIIELRSRKEVQGFLEEAGTDNQAGYP
ncbi:MAG: hypothetical protein MUO19_00180 [Dehalococcoidales bacterium]|nr:hypothetical protein [Dehalococcoidales bacterium]